MNILTQKHNDLLWIDIENPELASLKTELEKFNISDHLIEEIVLPTLRAKAEFQKDSIYLTLHFPLKKHSGYKNVEIDFLIKRDLIITSHYEEIDFLKNFIQNINSFNILEKGYGESHGGAFFAYFIRNFYKEIEVDLDAISFDIDKISKDIFQNDERKSIEDISITRRKMFEFESAVRFHKEVLESYCATALTLFGREYTTYSEKIMADYYKIWNTIEHQKNMLLDLKDTNDFLINNKTNELVKSFTIISYIVLPLSLLAGIFGMNAKMPSQISESPYGLIYLLLILVLISFLILSYLKTKKWM